MNTSGTQIQCGKRPRRVVGDVSEVTRLETRLGVVQVIGMLGYLRRQAQDYSRVRGNYLAHGHK